MKFLSTCLTTIASGQPKSSAGILWLTTYFAGLIWLAVNPHDYFTWFLEAAAALIGLAVPAAAHKQCN